MYLPHKPLRRRAVETGDRRAPGRKRRVRRVAQRGGASGTAASGATKGPAKRSLSAVDGGAVTIVAGG
jgi:hypothetical protein